MVTIEIQEDIDDAILARIEQTNFESSEEYVNFVLREVLESEVGANGDDPNKENNLEEQLEDLGYL